MFRWIINLFSKKPDTTKKGNPSWYVIAQGEIGVKEVYHGDNPRILEYHASTVLGALTDDVPWCSAFVCWCLERAGMKSTKSAWAKSYLKYGLKLDKPKVGCICVFTRGTGGHVGFFVAEDNDGIWLLSGNSSDQVKIAKYHKKNLLGYRWPVS